MTYLGNSVVKLSQLISRDSCFEYFKQNYSKISRHDCAKRYTVSSLADYLKFGNCNDCRAYSDYCKAIPADADKAVLGPTGDPPLLLSVRPYPKRRKCELKKYDSDQSKTEAKDFQISSEVMTVYNNWIKDRCSVGIQWDSYFQQTLLRSLHDETSNLPKYRTHSTPETEYEKPECSWSKEVIMSKYPEMEKLLSSHLSVVNLIRSYQMRGHLEAKLDPLKIGDSGITDAIEKPDYMPPARIVRNVMEGITEQDKSCIFQLPYYTFIGGAEKELSLKEIIYRLEKAYCQHIGVEYTFIRTVEKCQYIRQMFETPGITELNEDTKKKILYRLTKGVMFEKFILKTIGREKKFGLEGGESLIPALGQVIDMASCAGVNTFIIGMAHRGRLNVLANICKRPLQNIFSQFSKLEFDFGSGDVKYHLGSQVKRINAYSGKEIDIIILPNPSHLETVSPIVIGRTRSEQFFAHDEGDKIMSIMIHGDAAFSGQGVVYETLNLSKLPNYTCRGTIHFVINNQIGFTTDPRFSRSSTYCTDVGRIIKAPIFHVNGDDPEALIHCCNVAVEYRNKYKTDVIIDIVCYRRYGHNEVDDPGFTQPLMYKRINKLPNTLKLYTKKLVEENVVTSQEAKEMSDDFMKVCEEQFQLAKKEKQHSIRTWLDKSWDSFFENQDPNKIPCTGVKEGILKHIGVKVSSPPPKQLDFEIHTQLEKLLQHRMDLLNKMSVDWAMAEAMAFGSLLIEGNHVRLSGEDVERGTFGHRHAVYHHQSVDKETYMPLKHLSENQGDCTICNRYTCFLSLGNFRRCTMDALCNHLFIQRIPNLTGPVASMTSRCIEIRNKTAGRIDGCHGDCTSCCLCYASKILRNFRTPISFKEKIA
ncbi:hypothetical protein ANN_25927 [Periplaneta americana]|uniref:Uncharacterized protein n=1 Tax=Periplaneta americana TaxID=6978 RepID=A0ABQ8S4Z3_PERAM|nr:hypothetical protein ANN_25927 [Periplaneta americana]